MKKIYTSIVMAGALFFAFTNNANAQRQYQKNVTTNNIVVPMLGNNNAQTTSYLQKTTADCDTVNKANTWTPKIYGVQGGGGFVTGTNTYGDLEKAAFFNISALTNNSYISGAIIAFAYANSNTPASLNKNVLVKVYDGDATNGPNTMLGSYTTTLGALTTSVANSPLVTITFATPIAIPASKNFFVSLDVSNLEWGAVVKDSLAIYHSDDASTTVNPNQNGGAWEKWSDNSWNDVDASWSGLPIGLYIFPIVSSTATGCASVAPVMFTSFTGEKTNKGNILNWATATEINNKGFELLRSVNGSEFSSIAFIPSKAEFGNSNTGLNYTFTDKSTNTNSYYLLKQIDKDGKYAYSNVVLVKGDKPSKFELVNIYPNPATNRIKVTVTAPKATQAALTITDMTGRVVMQQNSSLNVGENNIAINVEALRSGNYIIKLTCAEGCESSIQKFIKQ